MFSSPKIPYAYLICCAGAKTNVRLNSKQANIMTKLINKSKPKRHAWRDFEVMKRPQMGSFPSTITKGAGSEKRTVVLNKLFMRHITDLMATGKSADVILGLGVEVTKVKISGDFNIVNVSWICNGSVEEEEVSKTLTKAAGMLREELTLLRVVGRVPNINFVRDRCRNTWSSVENLLKVADMGDDYVPSGVARLKDEFGNENTEKKEDLPSMRQNVFGVDREAMLERILSSMKGRKTVHEKKSPVQYELFDKEAFAQFLRQRKIMREKMEENSLDRLKFVEDDNIDEADVLFDDEEELDYLEENNNYDEHQK